MTKRAPADHKLRQGHKVIKHRDIIARTFVLILLLLSGSRCYAEDVFLVAIDSCSGLRQNTVQDEYVVECSGNLTLSQGSITSDVPVVIIGQLSINITNLRVTAPKIVFKSDGSISLGDGVYLNAESLKIDPQSEGAQPVAYFACGVVLNSLPICPAEQSNFELPATASSGVPLQVLAGGSAITLQAGESLEMQDSKITGGGSIDGYVLSILLLAALFLGKV